MISRLPSRGMEESRVRGCDFAAPALYVQCACECLIPMRSYIHFFHMCSCQPTVTKYPSQAANHSLCCSPAVILYTSQFHLHSPSRSGQTPLTFSYITRKSDMHSESLATPPPPPPPPVTQTLRLPALTSHLTITIPTPPYF